MNDRITVVAIGILGFICLVCITVAGYLAANDREASGNAFLALAGIPLGAIVGILVPRDK